MSNFLLLPSFYAHFFNGVLLLIAFFMLFKNYSKINNLEPYKIIVLILLFSIGIGIHGISHLGLENIYNYNPINLGQNVF